MQTEAIGDPAVRTIRSRAWTGLTQGRDRTAPERRYYDNCTHFHPFSGAVIMFTRDTGHHTSGWMKNPMFERCLHLSLSFREPMVTFNPDRLVSDDAGRNHAGIVCAPVPFDDGMARKLVARILGNSARLSWHEGPFSAQGRRLGVQHWRVFCDPSWRALKPVGEVYSTELTEQGWKSWSEAQAGAPPNWVSAA
jgi:hypothetical protein